MGELTRGQRLREFVDNLQSAISSDGPQAGVNLITSQAKQSEDPLKAVIELTTDVLKAQTQTEFHVPVSYETILSSLRRNHSELAAAFGKAYSDLGGTLGRSVDQDGSEPPLLGGKKASGASRAGPLAPQA